MADSFITPDGFGALSTEALPLIAAVLRGEDAPYPANPDPGFARRLLELIALHGVDALIHEALDRQDASASWPQEIRARLLDLTRNRAAWELLVKRELEALLGQLADARIEPLLLKGTPLAYHLYPRPYLRTRGDTDILVSPPQREQAQRVLSQAGYRAGETAGGSLATSELSYSKTDAFGMQHVADLHWRLSNTQIYARTFTFDELSASAVPVPSLGPAARMPCNIHALMIACLHRTSHLHSPYYIDGVRHLEANRLIWLYDIHLLAGRLSAEDWSQLIDLATTKGLRAVCLDGLQVTKSQLGTALPEKVLNALAAPGSRELSASYLLPGLWRKHWVSLRAMETWGQRLQLVKEWVFPPADYILRKYGKRGRWLVPWLYLRRALGSVFKRLR